MVEIAGKKNVQVDRLLIAAVKQGASDLHVKVNYKPILRINGHLKELETTVLDLASVNSFINGLLDDGKQAQFYEKKNLDASVSMTDPEGKSHRFRLNAAYDDNGPYATLRVIPDKIREAASLGFPNDTWRRIIDLQRGLVLVTGITGSGKTTTLASLIQEINKTRTEHIITIEDPIEYLYPKLKSLISQREIGKDVFSFSDGVKYTLRQDPDVILIGEVRDRETALKALEAAATGHLVFSTLHTINASETARRYVSLFEIADQENIRHSLAANLAYVLSQQLIPYQKGVGRTLAMEILNVQSDAVKNHIRKGEYHLIKNDIQTGNKMGMITMDQHLSGLYHLGKVPLEEVLTYCHDPREIKELANKV